MYAGPSGFLRLHLTPRQEFERAGRLPEKNKERHLPVARRLHGRPRFLFLVWTAVYSCFRQSERHRLSAVRGLANSSVQKSSRRRIRETAAFQFVCADRSSCVSRGSGVRRLSSLSELGHQLQFARAWTGKERRTIYSLPHLWT